MLGDLKKEKIKVNAVVTDCASEYETASIIKSRAALKNLATKIEEENNDTLKDFPRNILLNILDNKW
ncbi:2067_t:CDS:2 [Gigaspora rosea]|nr:2067_t:CDS:2 [Gigaspora rosea]